MLSKLLFFINTVLCMTPFSGCSASVSEVFIVQEEKSAKF